MRQRRAAQQKALAENESHFKESMVLEPQIMIVLDYKFVSESSSA